MKALGKCLFIGAGTKGISQKVVGKIGIYSSGCFCEGKGLKGKYLQVC